MGAIVGIGVDLESVDSFRKKKFSVSRRFYDRVFSKAEIKYCRKFRDAAPHFAARFCAKEAVVKAARGSVTLFITDFEVHNRPNGAPEIKARSARPHARRFLANHTVQLSLSHTDDYAVAFVVLVRTKKAS